MSSAPPPPSWRRADVQGLRAVAVLGVIAYHAGLPVRGGFLGVDVFFVISGFVITGVLLRERSQTSRVRLTRFYRRRIRRLAPALAALTCVTLPASAWVLSPTGAQQLAAKTAAGAHLLVANVVIARSSGGYFDPAAALNPFLHTWSLSVEEQIYLVVPLALIGAWALGRRSRRRVDLWVVATATALSLGAALLVALGIIGAGAGWFYNPLGRVWEFCAGALVALAPTAFGRRTAAALATAGLATVAVAFLVVEGGSTFATAGSLAAVVGTALVIAAHDRSPSPVQRLLTHRHVVRIGDLSYSLYLWHWPVIVLASVAFGPETWVLLAAAVVSVVPALASFRLVEEPARRRPAARRLNPSLLMAVCTIPPLALALGVLSSADAGYGSDAVLAAQRARAEPAFGVATCSGRLLCPVKPSGAGRPVYLVGDSHAGHFTDAAARAADEIDRPLFLGMAYNCPFVIGLDVFQQPGSGCLQRNEELREELELRPAGTVILSAADVYWSRAPWQVVASDGTVVRTETERLRAWRKALGETVIRLRGAGHDVVLVQSIPLQPDFDLDRCSMRDVRARECGRSSALGAALERQGAAREALEDVASSTGAVIMDPWATLCVDECSTGDDPYLYRNWSHLSVDGSLVFVGPVLDALRAAEAGQRDPGAPPPGV